MPTDLFPEINKTLSTIDPTHTVKVLLLGNSGVGKSMLLNVLLKEDEFESKFSSAAVTKDVEIDVLDEDGTAYLLYNVPGLLDPDEQVAKENGVQIEKAIRDRGAVPVITLFVLTTEGGRLRAEDLEAWRAITKFAPAIKTLTAVTFAVNKFDEDDFATEEDRDNYELSLRKQIGRLAGDAFNIVLLPKLTKTDKASPTSAARMKMRTQLMRALEHLKGVAVNVADNERIRLHSEELKSAIKQTRDQMIAMQEEFKRQAEANDEKHRAELSSMRQEADRARREADERHSREIGDLRAKIEAQKANSELNLKPLVDALAAMERQREEDRAGAAQRQSHHEQQMAQMMQSMQQMSIQPQMSMGGMGGGMHFMGDDLISLGAGHRSHRSHRSHRHSSSSGSSRRSAPATQLNWNEFRTANRGKGWSRADFSEKYQAHKRRFE